MTDESKNLEGKTRRGFLKMLGIGAAGLAIAGCVPGEQPWADWPVSKSSNVKRKHHERHGDDQFADGIFRDKESTIYDYLKFRGNHIESSYKLGRQSVVRLKKTCGTQGHGPECIPRSSWGVGRNELLDDQTILVTLRDKSLHYVLELDDTSCADLRYDPKGGKEKEPALKIRQFRIRDGKVVNPLPSSYGSGETTMKIRHWYDVVELDNFLRANFNGDSIFTEDDVFEARYFNNPKKILDEVTVIARVVEKDVLTEGKTYGRSLLERSSLLEKYARRYKRVTDREPYENVDARSKVLPKLNEAYSALVDEVEKDDWVVDPKSRLRKDEQKTKVLQSLKAIDNYLGVKSTASKVGAALLAGAKYLKHSLDV